MDALIEKEENIKETLSITEFIFSMVFLKNCMKLSNVFYDGFCAWASCC